MFIASCHGQHPIQSKDNKKSIGERLDISRLPGLDYQPVAPIAQFIVEIYEDRHGVLWFGTMTKGVARFDGERLSYLTTKDGLAGNAVSSITEDEAGNIWFGTHSGISKYDGQTFTNFTTEEGLTDNRTTRILIDQKGLMWIASFNGITRYDGSTFETLDLPNTQPPSTPHLTGQQWIRAMIEDRQGNIWLARDGYGVYRYDGRTFTPFTQKEGLASNSVFALQEDQQGHIWLGCVQEEPWYKDRTIAPNPLDNGGVCRYDGQKIMTYSEIDYEKGNNVYTLYEDKQGKMWISNIGSGVFRFDGQQFTNFKLPSQEDPTAINAVQSVLEDRNGQIWVGFSGGLYRLQNDSLIPVTKKGPWPKKNNTNE